MTSDQNGQNLFFRKPIAQRRVVVTGIGSINPLGLTASESWNKAIEGASGINKITFFDTKDHSVHIAGEVKGFDPEPYISKKDLKKIDRFSQFAIAASEMALKDSGISINDSNRHKVGVLIGSGVGGLEVIGKQANILTSRGPNRITPFFIPMVIANMASGHVANRIGAHGPNYSITSACSSGAHSIGEAALAIRNGVYDIAIAGGTEATISPEAVAGFANMKALSTRNDQPQLASRPFDSNRDGFVLGEGAGILILEDYESASKRGAPILAEISGYGASSDAHHMTNPHPEGLGASLSMLKALEDSSLNIEDIQYVNAHGTSTPVGDKMETLAIKKVFKDHASSIPVSSTKSMTGHLLGAAGAIESIFTIQALNSNVLPPTINLENPDIECDLDYVPITARDHKVTHTLSNSFGFGGTNATLIFSKI